MKYQETIKEEMKNIMKSIVTYTKADELRDDFSDILKTAKTVFRV